MSVFDTHGQDYHLPQKSYVLSGVTRWETIKGNQNTRVSTESILTLLSYEPETIFEKMVKLLLYLQYKLNVNNLGAQEKVMITVAEDFPICYAKNEDEFRYFLETLFETGYIIHISRNSKKKSMVLNWTTFDGGGIRLTPKGWQRLEQIIANQRDSAQAFIAMSFDESLNSVKQSIRKALEETNYKPVRLDDLNNYNGSIDDRIIAEIKKSGLVIAEYTAPKNEDNVNPNVAYEAGFARGLGITVIYCCRDDFFQKVKKRIFDVNHLPFILWKDEDELRQKLIDRIEATVPRKKKLLLA